MDGSIRSVYIYIHIGLDVHVYMVLHIPCNTEYEFFMYIYTHICVCVCLVYYIFQEYCIYINIQNDDTKSNTTCYLQQRTSPTAKKPQDAQSSPEISRVWRLRA